MPPHAIIALGFTLALTLTMAWVIVSDASRYIISNRLNLVVLILYGLAVGLLPIPLEAMAEALGAAGLVFAVGIALFALGLMGGGDVKLLVVLTLWTGWHAATPSFLFLTAMAGGLLVVLVLLLRALAAPGLRKLRPQHELPRLLTRKQPVPYGLAIAAGFLWLLWTGGVPILG